jgi:hypothetical protein
MTLLMYMQALFWHRGRPELGAWKTSLSGNGLELPKRLALICEKRAYPSVVMRCNATLAYDDGGV